MVTTFVYPCGYNYGSDLINGGLQTRSEVEKKPNLCGIDCQSDCECDSKCSACIPDSHDTEGDAPRLKCRQPQNEGPV